MDNKTATYEQNILMAEIAAKNTLLQKIYRVINVPPDKGCIMCQGHNTNQTVNELFTFNAEMPPPECLKDFFHKWATEIGFQKRELEVKLDTLLNQPQVYAEHYLQQG